MTLVLLPGMDGTGRLFSAFTAVSGPSLVIRYPVDEALDYDALLDRIQLPGGSRAPDAAEESATDAADRPTGAVPFILVGESFSGPLAVRLAANRPPGLRALVLVASFVRPPAPSWLTPFASAWAFRIAPPPWAIRRLLAGRDAPTELVERTRNAISSVRADVLALRLRQLLAVDVRDELAAVDVPVLYLQGRRDALVPPTALDAVIACRPSTRRVVLDAPHLVLQRRPREALAAILALS